MKNTDINHCNSLNMLFISCSLSILLNYYIIQLMLILLNVSSVRWQDLNRKKEESADCNIWIRTMTVGGKINLIYNGY